jgi:microcystin-dependent protein
MSDPFIGEIKAFPYNLVPRGWAACEGQILSIAQNQALFSLLGTTYGGNGVTMFALPDLRGRVPIHASPSIPAGAVQGEEAHTLTVNEMPQHTHIANASSAAASVAAVAPANTWATTESASYNPPGTAVAMAQTAISASGGSQPHPNMQPYLAVAFCIATQGIYPSRN